MFAIALGFLLLVLALVLAPARALPRPVFDRVDGRRDSLVFGAIIVLAACFAVCFVLVLTAS